MVTQKNLAGSQDGWDTHQFTEDGPNAGDTLSDGLRAHRRHSVGRGRHAQGMITRRHSESTLVRLTASW